MKKDCETCLKHDRNHHAVDCLYCMRADTRTIPTLLCKYFSKNNYDAGTSWPRIVKVNGTYFIKKYESFGEIGSSHYEALDYNCVHLDLEELIK